MKFISGLLLSLCIFSVAALAKELAPGPDRGLQEIEARLVKMPQMLGRFEQTKSLPQLPRPLLSKGIFALAEERGVSWRVLEPVESHLILSKNQAGGDPLTRQLAYPLTQILRGNFSALQELFVIEAVLEEQRWQLQLTPRAGQLAEFIHAIEVSGARNIERIRLLEANKAVTEIQLLDLRSVEKDSAELAAEFVKK
jgi:hypothetical protein